ncbi:hypothetical protein EfmAA242_11480 [Enterococcus faecium]|nr:hypothetical protein EfmAA242_11480 [Enterococcus faecium]
MKLFVGIDVSSEKLDVCFLTDDNQLSILSEISVANDIEGASFIRETILEFNNSYHFDQIVIGMESTSMYSFHPSMFFHEDEKLKKLNTLVTIENPFRVKQFSRMFDENKTDRNDESCSVGNGWTLMKGRSMPLIGKILITKSGSLVAIISCAFNTEANATIVILFNSSLIFCLIRLVTPNPVEQM